MSDPGACVDPSGPASVDEQASAVGRRRQLMFRTVFPGVFLAYLVETAAAIAERNGPAGEAAGLALLAVFCAAHVSLLASDLDGAAPGRYWSLFAVEVACFVAELPLAHEAAFVMVVFIVTLAVGRLYFRALPIVVGATAAALFLPLAFPSWHEGIASAVTDGTVFGIPLVGLAMIAFFGILRANAALAHARAEVARLAADNERNRIARDIHDLLGQSLTTVVVKAELARRLLVSDAEAASGEIAEVVELSRSCLAEVRAAVSSYRSPDLAAELAAGAELLRAAGITARLPDSTEHVVAEARGLFAWVLREGLTNVVRHSGATCCTVTLGPAAIEISDNGPSGSADPSLLAGAADPSHLSGGSTTASSGTGLAGLRERVAAAGATLQAGPGSAGGWRLRVELAPRGAAALPGRPGAASTAGPAAAPAGRR
ncbi:MAG: histidine kinase [Actinomycetota bacterium]|nr:histidine kinase [Actinomycetota bacterium]